MPGLPLLRSLFSIAIVSLAVAAPASAARWRPIPPEDFAATRPAFDPTAGAVILLRDLDIDCGEFTGSDFEEGEVAYYVRIKIFDQKGVDALAQLKIPYEPSQPPRGLAARVVSPDGTAVEVGRDAIFTRDAVRVGRESVRVKSFTFPKLEPGCIIEYQYLVRAEGFLHSMQIPMSDDFPIARARVQLRLMTGLGLGTQMLWHGLPTMKHVEGKNGRVYVYEATDIPVAVEEPFAPPINSYKPWFSFYLTQADGTAKDYWSYVAGDLAYGLARLLKPKRQIKEAAQRITAGITSDEARLQRLYDYCRTEIKNLSSDTSGYTPEQIEALKPNRNPVDTLTRGYGTALDINILFGAMLEALGAEPSFAYLGDRSRYLFTWNLKLRAALPHIVVALPSGAQYRFYDPGALYLPCGQLRWMNDGTSAIVIYEQKKEKYWKMIEVPRSPADDSITRRTARFQLDSDGNLEGDVTIELTGHDGVAAKHEYDTLTDAERTKSLLDALQGRLAHAEISDVVLENVTDPDKPIKISYHISAAGYADSSVGRIFVAPSFFQKGLPAVFPDVERRHPIFFPYAYKMIDDISITLPDGFVPEEPRAPAPVNVNGLLFYSPRMAYRPGDRRLELHREFTLEGQMLPAGAYAAVRHAFDRVAQNDSHTLALRRREVTAPAAETAADATP